MTHKTILAALLAASSALAQGLDYPADLQPGDSYRVLLVSDGTRDATSANLADYDAFVTSDANSVPFLAALGTTWHAVASSSTTTAKAHTGTASAGGVPIFRPDGVRIADDYEHLWGTSSGAPLLAAPAVTSSGTLTSDFVWAGTFADGTASAWPLGGASVGSVGNAGNTGPTWVYSSTASTSGSYHVYGLSDVLTVPYPDYPSSLQPGDQFRILFVTDSSRDATSTDVADYDAFVTADAEASPAMRKFRTNWRALASTSAVSARTHTETGGSGGVPIYRPDGVLVAANYGVLWGAAPFFGNTLAAKPNVTASGAPANALVWTGTTASGAKPLTCFGSSTGNCIYGDSNSTSAMWCNSNGAPLANSHRLYAISDVITVPEPKHPADLQPGAQYRMLFLTDGTRDATSSDIADYDAFVTADANAAPALRLLQTEWRALVSTPSLSARNHTAPGFGDAVIYRPDGVRVADSYTFLWLSGSFLAIPLLAKPTVTAQGASVPLANPWTGTKADGTTANSPLGGASGTGIWGTADTTSYGWMFAGASPLTDSRRFYAISGLITVPFPAVETSRVGTPANPDALLTGRSSGPVIGQTWDPIVDHTSYVDDAAIDLLFLGTAPANVPLPGLGTVLCDQLLGSNLVALPGQTFALAIPDDTGLLGVSLSTQALTLDSTWGLHLTNALDIVVGNQ